MYLQDFIYKIAYYIHRYNQRQFCSTYTLLYFVYSVGVNV